MIMIWQGYIPKKMLVSILLTKKVEVGSAIY